MNHYLFEFMEIGEEFIVQARDERDAWDRASMYFDESALSLCGEVTEEWAESSGLDEY